MLLNEQETRDLEERVLLQLRSRPAAGYRGRKLPPAGVSQAPDGAGGLGQP